MVQGDLKSMDPSSLISVGETCMLPIMNADMADTGWMSGLEHIKNPVFPSHSSLFIKNLNLLQKT